MPIPTVITRALAAFGLVLASLILTSVAEAKSIRADIRVVDSGGTVLAEQTQYTTSEDVNVKTDPSADCFGPGTGGSGNPAAIPGGTALSQVLIAGRTDKDLRPLSISDSFSFGLAVCGIGDAVSTQSGFLYLKKNLAGSLMGGDQTPVASGDSILWYVIEDFNDPVPDELVLNASNRPNAAGEITARVTAYADDGTPSPAVGATIPGAAAPTDADGVTTVPVGDAELLELTATMPGAIPSNEEVVCNLEDIGECAAGYSETIAGTREGEKIVTGREAELVLAAGGDDVIRGARAVAPDLVRCGGGEDTVRGYHRAGENTQFVSCEKVLVGKGK